MLCACGRNSASYLKLASWVHSHLAKNKHTCIWSNVRRLAPACSLRHHFVGIRYRCAVGGVVRPFSMSTATASRQFVPQQAVASFDLVRCNFILSRRSSTAWALRNFISIAWRFLEKYTKEKASHHVKRTGVATLFPIFVCCGCRWLWFYRHLAANLPCPASSPHQSQCALYQVRSIALILRLTQLAAFLPRRESRCLLPAPGTNADPQDRLIFRHAENVH